MTWNLGCYVRTPESYLEIFTANVGQKVRFSAKVTSVFGYYIGTFLLGSETPVKDAEVRFFKNDVRYASAKTRADGWADGDTTLTSADVGTAYFRAEAWDGTKKVASCSKTLAVQAAAAPTEGVPTTPAPEAAPTEFKCFIVTACFDSLKVAQVQRLRTFRDNCLPRRLAQLYYRVSPPAARFLRRHETLRVSARKLIEGLLLSPMRIYDKPTIEIRNDPEKPTKLEILAENLLDAFIDGCIAGLMTGWLVNPDIGWKVALGVGALKFFIRLKELRGK